MGRTRRVAVALVLLAGAACSSGDGGETGTTVPPGGGGSTTSSSSVATTAAAESYDVPEVIDQAYVQRVVHAYDKVLGDAIRILKREGAVTEEFLEHLLAIYTEPEFEVHQRAWLEAVANGDLDKRPANPGDPVTSVVAVIEATQRCVIARADRDLRPTTSVEPEESPEDDYIVLVRKKPKRDPASLNRTPWVMAFDGFKNDNTVPRASCDD